MRGEYQVVITEKKQCYYLSIFIKNEENTCFSTNTQVIVSKNENNRPHSLS